MATRLNESVCKATEEANEEKMRKKIDDVAIKVTTQFTNQWAQKEAALKNELVAGTDERAEKEPIEAGPDLEFYQGQASEFVYNSS